MKIISPFKDFYDVKVAKYGVDPLLVYERTRNLHQDNHHGGKYRLTRPRPEVQQHFDMPICHHACLLIGHYGIDLFITQHHVYSYFDAIKDKHNCIKLKKIHRNIQSYKRLFFNTIQFNDGKKYIVLSKFDFLNLAKRTQHLNDSFHTIPIVLQEAELAMNWYLSLLKDGSEHLLYGLDYNPNLSNLGIFLDPDFVWQALVEFLSDLRSEKEIMPEVANDDKITNKGFDVKRSFRPKMK